MCLYRHVSFIKALQKKKIKTLPVKEMIINYQEEKAVSCPNNNVSQMVY